MIVKSAYRKIVARIILLLGMLNSNVACIGSCFDSLPVMQYASDSRYSVFTGKVVSVGRSNDVFDFDGRGLDVVNIQVLTIWSQLDTSVHLVTFYNEPPHAEKVTFIKDSVYLIFALKSTHGNIPLYSTSKCDRTKLLTAAEYEISELRKYIRPRMTNIDVIPDAKLKPEADRQWMWIFIVIIAGTAILLLLIKLMKRKS